MQPHYVRLHWERFNEFQLVRFATPMDGNCLFHAIAYSFFVPYRTQTLVGVTTTRLEIVRKLRKKLSNLLSEPVNPPNKTTYYQTINRGTLPENSLSVPAFELKNMQAELDSNHALGFGYLDLIARALDKDIYILDAARQDIYAGDETQLVCTGTRNSIVIYYMDGHYETLGVYGEDGQIVTHFLPTNPFIRALKARVNELAVPSDD